MKKIVALNAIVASAHRESKTENGGDCRLIAAAVICSDNFRAPRIRIKKSKTEPC